MRRVQARKESAPERALCFEDGYRIFRDAGDVEHRFHREVESLGTRNDDANFSVDVFLGDLPAYELLRDARLNDARTLGKSLKLSNASIIDGALVNGDDAFASSSRVCAGETAMVHLANRAPPLGATPAERHHAVSSCSNNISSCLHAYMRDTGDVRGTIARPALPVRKHVS